MEAHLLLSCLRLPLLKVLRTAAAMGSHAVTPATGCKPNCPRTGAALFSVIFPILFGLCRDGELEQCVLKLAQTLVQQMVNRLGAASARLWFFDPQEGCFQSVAHAGLLSPAHDQIQRIYPDDSPLGRVAQEGLPLLSNDPAQEAWMPAPEWVKANGLRGFVAYPINRGEERLGALALLSRTPLEASFLIVKHAGARRIDLIIQPKVQQDAGSSINPQLEIAGAPHCTRRVSAGRNARLQ
jgi:hypothetical protein